MLVNITNFAMVGPDKALKAVHFITLEKVLYCMILICCFITQLHQ